MEGWSRVIQELRNSVPFENGSSDPLFNKIYHFLSAAPPSRTVSGSDSAWIGTTIGTTRSENQDRALAIRATYYGQPERDFVLAALADGMGGLRNGDDAAALCLSAFATRVIRTARWQPGERLEAAAHAANAAVERKYHGGAGSTISAICTDRLNRSYIVNVGDSRVYGIKHNRDLAQISQDDTLAGALGHRNDDSPHSSHLLQFIGMGEGIEPNIYHTDGSQYQALLISSDGVHGYSSDALAHAVRSTPNRLELVRRLLNLSDALGGRDNATAIAVPPDFDQTVESAPPGISLTLWTFAKELQIWIVSQNETSRVEQQQIPSPGDARKLDTPPVSLPPAQKAKPSRAKSTSKRSRQKKAPGSKPQPTLPLTETDDPKVEIKFPKPTED